MAATAAAWRKRTHLISGRFEQTPECFEFRLLGEYVLDMAESAKAAGSVAVLNAFSGTPEGDAVLPGIDLEEPAEALQKLADLFAPGGEEAADVDRLLVLNALVKLAKRKGVAAHRTDVELALKALAGGSDAAAEDGFAALEAVETLPQETSGAEAWETFVAGAGDALQLSDAELQMPQCNDTRLFTKVTEHENGEPAFYEARCVTVEFYTDVAPGKLLDFCDPTMWHELSSYQQEMEQIPGSPEEARGDGWWRRDLTEKVELLPNKILKTPLRFTHSVEKPVDPAWVHLDYVQIEDTDEIHVDEGALDVRRVASGPQRGRTHVSAKKAIFFDDRLFQNWTTIACDTFWTDTVVAAAVKSADGSG